MLILSTIVAHNVSRSRLGRAFITIRDNDLAAEVLGVNLFRVKLQAFFLAAVLFLLMLVCRGRAAGGLALAATRRLDRALTMQPVVAAQRRGVVDDGEAERNGKDATNIHPAFRISGLGQLIEAAIESDRLMVFGD